jgi:hypothetical protein
MPRLGWEPRDGAERQRTGGRTRTVASPGREVSAMNGPARRIGHLWWLTWVTLLALGLAACGGSAAAPFDNGSGTDLSVTGKGGGAIGAPMPAPIDATTAAPAAAEPPGGTTSTPNSPGSSDLLIIKTGMLELRVKEIDPALAAASAKIADLGGYISGSQRTGDGDQSVATATYRIPAARWDSALVALRALAIKILSEQTQTQEVTGQVSDLGAQITNLRATEQALQAIMVRATKISDVLAVQEQLTGVRGQIDQLTTAKKHLEEQAAFSTLTVAYSLPSVAAVTVAQKGFDPGAEVDRAMASLVGIMQSLAATGIWFGIVLLPVLLVLGLIALVVLAVVRRIRRSRARRDSRATILPTPEA